MPDPEPDPDVVDRHALERAKGGDDRAFAALVRAHDPDLHALVAFLVDADRVDEVLRIAYLKAYRALARLRDDRPPRLWLHQIVLLAVVDELRRRSRRRTRTGPRKTDTGDVRREDREPDETRSPLATSGVTILGPDEHDDVAVAPGDPAPPDAAMDGDPRPALLTALDSLSSDQRVAVALVDGVALTPTEAALVADTPASALNARLAKGRAAMRAKLTLPDPEGDTGADLAERFDATEVPPHAEGFWHEVGQHLLAARAAPAPAASPIPEQAVRRTNAVVPSAPTSRRKPGGVDPEAVRDLAGQARRRRPRDTAMLRRVVLGVAALVLLAAVVIGGFALSARVAHHDTQLGTTSAKVISQIDDALQNDAAVSGTATVSGSRTTVLPGAYAFVRAADGSYHVSSEAPQWDEAYDAAAGTYSLFFAKPGAQPVALQQRGLPAGAPDLTPAVGFGLGDPLTSAVRLLRGGNNLTLTTLGNNGNPQWVIDADLHAESNDARGTLLGVGSFANPSGADHVRVTFDQSLRLPTQVQFTKQTELVTTITFSGLEIANHRPSDELNVNFAPGTSVTQQDFGFQPAASATTGPIVGYSRVTPSYLPSGFTLAVVAARQNPLPGSGSTGANTNPAAKGVVSYAYRHGSAVIVITTRSADAPAGARWTDPFSTATSEPADAKVHIDDGYFYGVDGFRGSSPLPHLWGHNDKLVFTIAGDASASDLAKIATSLH